MLILMTLVAKFQHLIIILIYNLSGTIPDFDLPELKYLILHNNDLSGITPSFDSCFALIDIWLNHNDLSGQLPEQFQIIAITLI